MANMPYQEPRIARPLEKKKMMWLWTPLAVVIFSSMVIGQQQEGTGETSEKWATTQNNIGNTLKDQAASVEGSEATRLFGEAAAAYRRALSVFTRESRPEDWATTQ